MSYTPEPWKVYDHETKTCYIESVPTNIRVADVWATDLPGGIENARLIAAAPELYEALRSVVLSLENSQKITTDEIRRLYTILHKAEGK